MPGPAKAFVTAIEDFGVFTNPGDGAFWLDLKFRCVVVGADGVISRALLAAHIDPTLTGAATNAVIAQAVSDFATSKGNTLAANQTFLLAFNRV